MRCEDFHSRVNEILDTRGCPSRDSSLVAHAAFCGPCGQALENYQSLVSGFSCEAKHQTQTAKPISRRRVISVFFSISVVMLFAITLGPFRGEPTQPMTVATVQALPQAETAQSAGSIGPVATLDSTGQLVEAPFVQPFVGVQLIASTNWSTLAPKEMPFGVTLPEIETEWMQVVEKEMSPVTESVNSTVELIFRTLSTGTSSA